MPSETAYAKINLALHVRRRRDDGYHELETIFAFCEDGDLVAAEAAEHSSLEIEGLFSNNLSNTDNLVLDAARLSGCTARLMLTKMLPVASGLGGGSADAAATLRLLARMNRTALPSLDDQRALGADVPACVISQTRRGDGVGEVLSDAPAVTGMAVLLVNPGIPLSTKQVFVRWDGVDRGPLDDWRDGRNDLETPAIAVVPEIATLLNWLRSRPGVLVARMSGSGATCFALFSTALTRKAAAQDVRAVFPGYWVMESTLR